MREQHYENFLNKPAVDGDTISVGGERIRILDIDAPESFESRCDDELKLALKAKERLRAAQLWAPAHRTARP